MNAEIEKLLSALECPEDECFQITDEQICFEVSPGLYQPLAYLIEESRRARANMLRIKQACAIARCWFEDRARELKDKKPKSDGRYNCPPVCGVCHHTHEHSVTCDEAYNQRKEAFDAGVAEEIQIQAWSAQASAWRDLWRAVEEEETK